MRQAEGFFAAIASILVEEYRVERAIWDTGRFEQDIYTPALAAALLRLHSAFGEAVGARMEGSDLDVCIQAVAGIFEQLMTHLSYVAARLLGGASSDLPRGVAL